MSHQTILRISGWFLLLPFIMASLGCSSGPTRPQTYNTSGKVVFDQKPIGDAQLVFHPVTGNFTPLPMAISREDGQFDVTTWVSQDGMPAGDYVVTVTWKQLVQQGEEKTRSGRNLLPAHYADPKRSPLKCNIKPDTNLLPTFELSK